MYIFSTYSRFHAVNAAEALARAGNDVELHIRDSKARSELANVQRGSMLDAAAALIARASRVRAAEMWCIERFDAQVASRLGRLASRDTVFHGFSAYCQQSLRVSRDLGIRTAVERSGAHLSIQRKLLQDEFARLGLPHEPASSADSRADERMLAEYQLADRIVVSSSFCKDSFVQAGVNPDRLAVVPLGANFPVTTWQPRQTRPFTILSIGNELARKGMLDVLEAYRLADLADSALLIRSPTLPAWNHLLQSRRGRTVEVLPPLPHTRLREYYRAASVFCLLSIEDGFGLVVLEAMALGCPVIVSTNVGAKDVVTEGKDGFVVDIRRPEQVAERLSFLQANPDVLQEMSRCAHETAKRYTWTRYAEGIAKMWASLPGTTDQ
jgi:glycosyltransferase involved in cell wall biosynthesis